jgi:hypothetical protein
LTFNGKALVPNGGPEPKKADGQRQKTTHRLIGGNYIQWQKKSINLLRSVNAMHARNARNVMHARNARTQCNAMQCNVSEVRPSVRNEVSQSFFFILKIQKMTKLVEARFELRTPLKWKSECTDGRTYGMKSFYLSQMEISM